MTKEQDMDTQEKLPRWRDKPRWWSWSWLKWWWDKPTAPSLYDAGEAAPDQRTYQIQLQRWLEREP